MKALDVLKKCVLLMRDTMDQGTVKKIVNMTISKLKERKLQVSNASLNILSSMLKFIDPVQHSEVLIQSLEEKNPQLNLNILRFMDQYLTGYVNNPQKVGSFVATFNKVLNRMSNAGDKEVREASLVIYAKLITLDPKKNKIETIFPEKLNEQKLKRWRHM